MLVHSDKTANPADLSKATAMSIDGDGTMKAAVLSVLPVLSVLAVLSFASDNPARRAWRILHFDNYNQSLLC